MTLAVFLGSLFGLMLLGMPIAFALMLTAVALMFHLDFFDAQIVSTSMLNGADSFPLMAVPFFVLAGEIMNAGGISQRIINLAVAFVGHIKGGLGYVAIGAAVLLASLSGSAIADTAALGTLLIPMMRDNGYPVPRSAGLIAAGGIIGPIIPPSMPFIIFGVTTNQSISGLFMAGIVPGLLMGTGLCIAWKWAVGTMTVKMQPRMPMRDRLRVVREGTFALVLPAIIIGGLRFGLFTPTEAAVVAAVYSLFVTLVIYREIGVKDMVPVFVQAARTTATVMFLVAGAMVSSYMVTLAELPDQVVHLLKPAMGEPRLLMAAMALLLLAVGTVMDMTPTILVLGPVLTPIAIAAGIDPLYFGVMFVLIGMLGTIHPPVCTVLNVVSSIAKVSLEKATVGILPFLLVYLVLVGIMIVFPQIVIAPAHFFYH